MSKLKRLFKKVLALESSYFEINEIAKMVKNKKYIEFSKDILRAYRKHKPTLNKLV